LEIRDHLGEAVGEILGLGEEWWFEEQMVRNGSL
jgi:hypothetical protein